MNLKNIWLKNFFLIEKKEEEGKILVHKTTKRKTFLYKKLNFLNKFCKTTKVFEDIKYLELLCNNNFKLLYSTDLKIKTSYFYKKLIVLNENLKKITEKNETPKYLKTTNMFGDHNLYSPTLKNESYFFSKFRLFDKNLKKIKKNYKDIRYIEIVHLIEHNEKKLLYTKDLKYNSGIYESFKKFDKNLNIIKNNKTKLCYIEIEYKPDRQLFTSSLKNFTIWYRTFKVIENENKTITIKTKKLDLEYCYDNNLKQF